MKAKAKAQPKRWQDCEPFLQRLRVRGYLTAGDKVCMSDGIYLYMYELWLDGLGVAV